MSTAFKQISDNAYTLSTTTLINPGVTSIVVSSGTGSLFPQPGNGFYVTLYNSTLSPLTDPNMEKVTCTARSGDTFTITATANTHSGITAAALLDVSQNTTDLQTAVNTLENSVINVKDGAYGVKGDGVTNDLSAIQTAAAAAAGKILYFPSATYKVTLGSSITLSGNTRVVCGPGVTFDVSGSSSSTTLFSATGSFSTTLTDISGGTATAGASSFTWSAAGGTDVVAGDWIQVYSSDIYDTGASAAPLAEIVQVESITGTTSGTVTLKSPLDGGTYTTTPQYRKVNFVSNVEIEGGYVLGPSLATTGVTAVKYNLAYNCRLNNMRTKYCNGNAFWIVSSLFFNASQLYCEDALSTTSGYGVNFSDCSQDCTVSDSQFIRVRHGVTNTSTDKGICRRISYNNLKVYNTINNGDSFDTHGNAKNVTFTNCFSYDASANGFNSDGADAVYNNCQAIRPTKSGFTWAAGSHVGVSSVAYNNCHAISPTLKGFDLSAGGATNGTVENVVLNGCVAKGCGNAGLLIGNSTLASTTVTWKNLTIIGGYYDGNLQAGSISIQYNVTDFSLIGVIATANASARNAIKIEGSRGTIIGSHGSYTISSASNASFGPFSLKDATDIVGLGNIAYLPTSAGAGAVVGSGTLSGIKMSDTHATGGGTITGQSVVTVTTTYAINTTDYIVLGDATGGTFTATLPTAVGILGKIYILKKTDAGANTFTIATTSAQTINGSATASLTAASPTITVVSDNANWITI